MSSVPPFAFGQTGFGQGAFGGQGSPVQPPWNGGQTLTPNPNVYAAAGNGGDVWGANGGGATPIGGGATDQTGFVYPVAVAIGDAQLAANYLSDMPDTTRSVLEQESDTLLSALALVTSLNSGGSNAG